MLRPGQRRHSTAEIAALLHDREMLWTASVPPDCDRRACRALFGAEQRGER